MEISQISEKESHSAKKNSTRGEGQKLVKAAENHFLGYELKYKVEIEASIDLQLPFSSGSFQTNDRLYICGGEYG